MQQPQQVQGSGRARTVLSIVSVLLLALLIGLIAVFFNLLKPTGLPDESDIGAGSMQWVRSIYGFGPAADQQLLQPSSVAIAPNGDIYATDPQRARVMIFRSDGTFKGLLHTGAGGTAEGQFIRPESIDVDDNGDIYIADSWAKKVVVFGDDLAFKREFPVDVQARGVSVVGDKLYVLDVGHVIVFDKNSGERYSNFAWRGPDAGQIDAYQGVTARGKTVYVADTFNKRLQAFSDKGILEWAVPGGIASRKGPAGSKDSGPDASASDAVPGHRWDMPQDLVFDGAGRLVVVDAFLFEIAAVDVETGKVQARYGDYGRADGQFYYPSSIDYDKTRDWFAVADTMNNRIQIVRIPGSGGGALSGLWRAFASPFRFLIIPAILLLFMIAVAIWASRKLLGGGKEDAPLTDSAED